MWDHLCTKAFRFLWARWPPLALFIASQMKQPPWNFHFFLTFESWLARFKNCNSVTHVCYTQSAPCQKWVSVSTHAFLVMENQQGGLVRPLEKHPVVFKYFFMLILVCQMHFFRLTFSARQIGAKSLAHSLTAVLDLPIKSSHVIN